MQSPQSAKAVRTDRSGLGVMLNMCQSSSTATQRKDPNVHDVSSEKGNRQLNSFIKKTFPVGLTVFVQDVCTHLDSSDKAVRPFSDARHYAVPASGMVMAEMPPASNARLPTCQLVQNMERPCCCWRALHRKRLCRQKPLHAYTHVYFLPVTRSQSKRKVS
jgi:hypothetical protein